MPTVNTVAMMDNTMNVMIWKRWITWRHQMETFSALLAICAGNSPVPGEFPAQRPVTQSFDVFLDLRLNKRLSKQWWGWWFETLSRPLWRHCNDQCVNMAQFTLFVSSISIGATLFSFVMSSSNGSVFRVAGPLWGKPPVAGGFPLQRASNSGFDVLFDVGLNKLLNKQPNRRWFETPRCLMWRHCNASTAWKTLWILYE